MRLTRRSFLKSLMIGTAVAAVPLRVQAARPTAAPHQGRINYSTHAIVSRCQGKAGYQAHHAIAEALSGTNITVWTGNFHYQYVLYSAIAKAQYGVDLCFLCSARERGKVNMTHTYRLDGQQGAGLITFMEVG